MPTRFLPPPTRGARLSRATAIALFGLGAGCSGGSSPPDAPLPPSADPTTAGEPPNVAAGRTAVLAPIESAELVRESSPQRFAIRVASGLPSGCSKFERIDVARDGYVLNVSVWNTRPSDPGVACTMIYGIAENTAELGGNFTPGESYSVHVNGEPLLEFTPE